MKSFVLLAIIAGSAYYYYLQHPMVFDSFRQRPAATTAAPTPRQQYHSPLDATNNHSSAGYFSDEPSARYEVTGPRATTSTQAAPTNPAGDAR